MSEALAPGKHQTVAGDANQTFVVIGPISGHRNTFYRGYVNNCSKGKKTVSWARLRKANWATTDYPLTKDKFKRNVISVKRLKLAMLM